MKLIGCQTTHLLNCQRSALTFLVAGEPLLLTPRPLPHTHTHRLPVLETSDWKGKGKEREKARPSLPLRLHPSSAPLAPALQSVPLLLPPQLIIVTDYLTASPTVTCFGLTNYAIWATWPGSGEPREVTERGKWLWIGRNVFTALTAD